MACISRDDGARLEDTEASYRPALLHTLPMHRAKRVPVAPLMTAVSPSGCISSGNKYALRAIMRSKKASASCRSRCKGRNEMDPPLCGSTAMSHKECTICEPIEP